MVIELVITLQLLDAAFATENFGGRGAAVMRAGRNRAQPARQRRLRVLAAGAVAVVVIAAEAVLTPARRWVR